MDIPVPFCHVPLRNRAGQTVASAIVDWEDYDRVMQYRWSFDGSKEYAKGGPDGVRLSHFIHGKPEGGNVVDHINHERLDNRKNNLRDASLRLNSQNKRKRRGASSTYIGVCWSTNEQRWKAACGRTYVGLFVEEKEAAKAYDQAALFLYGPGAKTNGLSTVPSEPEKRAKGPVKKSQLPTGIGFKGKKYSVRFAIESVERHVGVFDTVAEAKAAYDAALAQAQLAITERKQAEAQRHLKIPITRTHDGIAVIGINRPGDMSSHMVLVDDDVWHELMRRKWHINTGEYAAAIIDGQSVRMHKLLMPGVAIVDHINHNRLDNRRVNRRDASRSDNSQNKSLKAGILYRGIHLKMGHNRWTAQIMKDRQMYYLGSFATAEEAARAYDAKAKELYSKPALNFPEL